MDKQVTYRPYEEADFPVVVRLIEDVWDYEAVGSASLARHLAEQDLLKCLRTRSFSQVAVSDGQVVGYILGMRTATPPDPSYDFRLRLAQRGLRRSPKGLILRSLDKKLEKINARLLRQSGRQYGAQLSYFALREEYRGRGIGAELYRAFRAAMAEQGAGDFYVFTDTASSYGFYEHMGMKRKVTYTFRLPVWQAGGTEFYLYEAACEEAVGE